MAKFLSDDTLESNQGWEADSHLQKSIPLGSNQSGGTHLQQTKSLWGRTSLGELETYTHSANYCVACYEAISYACNAVFNKSLPEMFILR